MGLRWKRSKPKAFLWMTAPWCALEISRFRLNAALKSAGSCRSTFEVTRSPAVGRLARHLASR